MLKVIFCTNLPSPYRVDFFNELGKYCDLTVLYERKSSAERDHKWVGTQAQNFKEVYLELEPVGIDRAKGTALRDYVKCASFDILICTNYVSPATMGAIVYCRMHHVPYFIEYDGGFCKKDPLLKGVLKRFLLKGAKGHFTTADEHIRYLQNLGVRKEKIYKYPFTSLKETELQGAGRKSGEARSAVRQKLGMREEKIILSVGRFSYDRGYGKGYDVLLETAKHLPDDTGVYIVGDEPTQEFMELKVKNKLDNVYFVGFRTKTELKDYYIAADLFILLTRGDIWGLVINEAMMYGLPVITTRFCIAGTELVREGQTGYLVGLEDPELIADKCQSTLSDEREYSKLSDNCYRLMKSYTIEKMAERHMEIFGEISGN